MTARDAARHPARRGPRSRPAERDARHMARQPAGQGHSPGLTVDTASPLQRLLAHAQRLMTLAGASDIMAASCREVLAVSGATRAFASCCLPKQPWDRGVHTDTDPFESRAA